MISAVLVTAITAASLSVALAQSTVNVLQPAFLIPQFDPLAAEIIGVGADGTTFIVSNVPTDTADGIFYTETLVQDATHISMVAILAQTDTEESLTQTVTLGLQCTYSSIAASATEVPADCVIEGTVNAEGVSTVTTETTQATLVGTFIAASTASGVSVSSVGSTSGGSQTTVAPASGATSGFSGSTSGSSATAVPTTTSAAVALETKQLCLFVVSLLCALTTAILL